MRARSRCMRTPTAECRPNAPWITSARPRLASQPSADHLLRALPLCLPVRSFHNLLRSWRGRRHRSRGMRLGTARHRSNAPDIAPARLRLAEQCQSDPRSLVSTSRAGKSLCISTAVCVFAGRDGSCGGVPGVPQALLSTLVCRIVCSFYVENIREPSYQQRYLGRMFLFVVRMSCAR